MFAISETKKKQGRYCCAYACTNRPNPRKGGLCDKHYARKRRELDPVYTRYNQFKSSATRRKKPFSITLEQFREFCQETGYIVSKGMRGMRSTIDRVDNKKGYHIDNIQLLTLRQNASKGEKECPF